MFGDRSLLLERWRNSTNSKSFAVRGVIAVLFGIVVSLMPAAALFTLVIAVGAYAFLDGFFALMATMSPDRRASRAWLVLEGALGIVLGVVAFSAPELTATALIYLIGIWSIVTGMFRIAAAIRLRKELRGEGLIMLSGVGSVLLGLILIILPLTTALAITWMFGAFGIIWGAVLLVLAVRYRSLERAASEAARKAA